MTGGIPGFPVVVFLSIRREGTERQVENPGAEVTKEVHILNLGEDQRRNHRSLIKLRLKSRTRGVQNPELGAS